MTAAFSRILSELLQDALVQADSAAIENMRCLSLPTGCDPQDLTDFLVSAAEIRLARARQQGIGKTQIRSPLPFAYGCVPRKTFNKPMNDRWPRKRPPVG